MQTLGIFNLSFKNLRLDGLVCGSHKWLNAPVGVAFLILKKELISKVKPLSIGSGTYGTCDDPSDFACEPKQTPQNLKPVQNKY
jgi:selenocysteine lyase/cysteine desulfurase